MTRGGTSLSKGSGRLASRRLGDIDPARVAWFVLALAFLVGSWWLALWCIARA